MQRSLEFDADYDLDEIVMNDFLENAVMSMEP